MRGIRNGITLCIGDRKHFTPCIVGVFGKCGARHIDDRDHVALQILVEVIADIVIENSANRAVVIISIALFESPVNQKKTEVAEIQPPRKSFFRFLCMLIARVQR